MNASENGDYGACVAGVDWVAKVVFDELKRQAPLWKKEIRADGEIWKTGLG